MPRYLIHIGPHKTGTTYLQHAFTRFRVELAARGVLYPEQWGSEHGHHTLADALIAGQQAELVPSFEQLNGSGFDVILLSSETFAWCDSAAVARLHALVGDHPVTIVFYCRRWSELIPSRWHEIVKHGSLMTMPEMALSSLANPEADELINFDLVLSRFGQVFGHQALQLVSYNGVMEAGDDLFAHFCRHFLDWSDAPETGLGRVNPSLDMVDSEIIRALNALEWTRAREGRERLFARFMAAKESLPVRRVVEQGMQYTVDAIQLDDAAPALARLHGAIARRYSHALVEPLVPQGLFAPKSSKVLYIRTDYLWADGVLDTLKEMQATLLQAAQRD